MQSVMQHITGGTPSQRDPPDHPRPEMDIVQTSHCEPQGRGERGDLNIPNWFPASHSVCFNYSPILDSTG